MTKAETNTHGIGPHVGGGRNPHYEGCFEDETPAQAEERWRVASTEAQVRAAPAQPWTDGDRLYRKVKGAYAGSTWKPVVTWAGDDGVTKMVGESTVIPGLLHIFALDQMEAV